MSLDRVTAQAVNDEHDAACDRLDAKLDAIHGLWEDYVGPTPMLTASATESLTSAWPGPPLIHRDAMYA